MLIETQPRVSVRFHGGQAAIRRQGGKPLLEPEIIEPTRPYYDRVINQTNVPVRVLVCMHCWRSGWTIATPDEVDRDREYLKGKQEADFKMVNTFQETRPEVPEMRGRPSYIVDLEEP